MPSGLTTYCECATHRRRRAGVQNGAFVEDIDPDVTGYTDLECSTNPLDPSLLDASATNRKKGDRDVTLPEASRRLEASTDASHIESSVVGARRNIVVASSRNGSFSATMGRTSEPNVNVVGNSSGRRSEERRSHHPHSRSQPRSSSDEAPRGRRRPPPPPTQEPAAMTQVDNSVLNPELLPDILNSHLPPPPYSTLPQNTERTSRRGPPPSPPRHRPSLLQHARRVRGSPRTSGGTQYTPDDEPKHCCGVVVTQTVSIRWFIVMIAFVGICCAVVGTVLGALKATGREHLTVSLLMIGVGIVLITVSGIAWRLTSHDAPSCRMMLGLQSEDPEPNRRFVPRVPPSYGRSHHPYAAMMYPEFPYRPPPPSYQASMQEYRLRLLLLDRQHPPAATSPVSPPPTYRSNMSARPPLTFSRDSDYSHPPSYRSRSSSVLPRPPDPNGGTPTDTETPGAIGNHSRDPSLSLSCLSHESLFEARPQTNMGSPQNQATTSPQDYSLEDSQPSLQKILEEERKSQNRKSKDTNAVTIVQTTDSSQVVTQDAVIVTISGHNTTTTPNRNSGGRHLHGEVEILAHL